MLVAGGQSTGDVSTASAEVYDDPSAGSWTNVTSLNTPRTNHTATLLPSGKVFVVGGSNGVASLTSAEVYDPSANTWTTVVPLNTARSNHTATLLPSGKVLVAGGYGTSGYLTSAEVYDPSANTWTTVVPLNAARSNHKATLLPSGKVLVTGGSYYDGTYHFLASAEVYDPSANTWTTVASMNTARGYHAATLLPSGKVLVTGGWTTGVYLAGEEVYDPNANTWTNVASLNTARFNHAATLLPSGKVLIEGGGNSYYLTSAEVYDPNANTWTTIAPLNIGRLLHTATLLPSGKVLVAGGAYSGGYSTSAEVYDPSTNTWTTIAPLNSGREQYTATLLPSGKVLVAGGYNGGYLSSAEVYDRGLGFSDSWRPIANPISSPLTLGNTLSLPGSGYRGYGYEEGSGGGTNNSATNYPLVQIRRIDNEQWLWVSPSAFNITSFTSLPVANIPAGPAMVTVFVNGIPSYSQSMVVMNHYSYLFLPFMRR